MATPAQWIDGARPRTLPAAVAPVVGTAAAMSVDSENLGLALLALIVSVCLQVAVNYANDYSDGIRGTDADRAGPARLVGGGRAKAENVKIVAFGFFGLAALAGLTLVALSFILAAPSTLTACFPLQSLVPPTSRGRRSTLHA